MAEQLRDQVAAMVETSSGGTVSAAEALDASSDLLEKGFSSLSFLQLIDSLEIEFGLYIDLEGDTSFMRTVDGIVGYIDAQRS